MLIISMITLNYFVNCAIQINLPCLGRCLITTTISSIVIGLSRHSISMFYSLHVTVF
uniref:Uncharacterized protein n=1 Tax=Oryzias latipes TaxID=8090 RepID=A0A3P9L751_ORYLA